METGREARVAALVEAARRRALDRHAFHAGVDDPDWCRLCGKNFREELHYRTGEGALSDMRLLSDAIDALREGAGGAGLARDYSQYLTGTLVLDVRGGCVAVYPKCRENETAGCHRGDSRNIFFSDQGAKFIEDPGYWEHDTSVDEFARRLVACWNACTGNATEGLEAAAMAKSGETT